MQSPTEAAEVGFIGDVEAGVQDAKQHEGKGNRINLYLRYLGKLGHEHGGSESREVFKGIELSKMGAAMPSGESFVKGSRVLNIVGFGDAGAG